MSMKEEISANRNSITIAVAVVLCVAALAYSKGWFSPSTPSPEPVSPKVSASQTMDPDKTKQEADKVTLKATKPTRQATD
jgi:hypothetical protein